MGTLKKISSQTIWQLIGKIVTSLTTVIILGAVARRFGASEVGVLTLALTYLGFFSLFADFGLNAHILPRFLKGDITIEWKKFFGLRLLITLLATLLAGLIIVFWPGQEETFRQTVLLGLVGVAESGFFVTIGAVFQSKLRFDLSAMATTVGTFVILVTVYLMIQSGFKSPWLILGYSLGWVVTGVLGFFIVKGYVKQLAPIFDFGYIKQIFIESWPISATILLNLIYFRLDAFILSYYRSFAEVGVYNLAYQIFQTLLVFPAFIMNSFYPVMLKDFSENIRRFKTNIFKAIAFMLGIAVAGAVLTIIFSPLVISLISGNTGFSGSVDSLQILSLGFPAFFVSSVLMWTLIVFKRYKTMLIIYVSGLLVNITLNFLFIPRFTYIASSWITVFSEILIVIMQILVLFPILFRNKQRLQETTERNL